MGREARRKADRRSDRQRLAQIAAADAGRRLARAGDHIEELDQSIQAWFDRGCFALIDRPDPDTGHHVLYARISEPMNPDWSLLAGDAVHSLRSALDLLAYDILAAAHRGAVPSHLQYKSSFPIVGEMTNSGSRRQDPDAEFRRLVSQNLAGIPDQAIHHLREIQPFHSTTSSSSDILLVDDLDRIQKHRRLTLTSASAYVSNLTMGGTGYFPHFWVGGGPVVDGTKVAEWADPQGPSPRLEASFDRRITFGEGEPAAGQALVETLRSCYGAVTEQLNGPLSTFTLWHERH